MKASELMVGDWVRFKSDSEITKINAYGLCNWILSNIEPIPLTSEILEKNGFIQNYSYNECVADGCFVEVKGWSYHAENIHIEWDGMGCHIINDLGYPCEEIVLREGLAGRIYVHQLQHALRLCGLNDLADNFKV